MKKSFLFLQLLALLLASCTGNVPNGPGESHSETGMYVGITAFSDNVEFYQGAKSRYNVLTKSNSAYYSSFINSLSMGDATVLYYAVDNNLNYLANSKFPDDLSSVNIITFTDGLDQGSRALDKQDGNNGYAANDDSYVSAIHKKLQNTKVGGVPITAYAIGIRGTDVQGDAAKTFSDNLVNLSSAKENAMEVSNMDEVNAKFKEIAESLYKKSESRDLTITIPMPSENEKERFTFDDVTDATSSTCYLEGVYAKGALTNITYVGCMSNSGSKVVEESAGGVKIKFNFVNFTDDKGEAISTTHMQQWHMGANQTTWTRNSEFKPSESIVTNEERKTAVVMLILDCSSSLGDDFSKVKSAANNFINTLAGEISKTSTTDNGDSSNQAYVRFRKEKAYNAVLYMGIHRYNGDKYVSTVEYAFGTDAGTSRYFSVPAGDLYPTFYNNSYDDSDYGHGWQFALGDEVSYNFLPGKKYTYTCGNDGAHLKFTITQD